MLPDRPSADRSATRPATFSPAKEPADVNCQPASRSKHSVAGRTLTGPLSNLPATAREMRQIPGSHHDAEAGGQSSRVRRWAAGITGFFSAPSAAAAEARANTLRQWRPANPAFQHFHELIDSIGTAPDGNRAAIAKALEARLRDAGLMLPLHQLSAAQTTMTLLSSKWFDALCDHAMNIGELLSALRRSDEVDANLRPELRRRLITAFEVVIHRLAENHAGVAALRDGCTAALRPPQEPPARPPDAGARMRAFGDSARRLLNEPVMRNATAGSLAARLFECLRQDRDWSEDEELSLGEQIAPTLEAIIHTDAAARRIAGPLREAGIRLQDHLDIGACRDLAEPKKRPAGPTQITRMEPHRARAFLYSGLLRCALDPAVLDARLRDGAVHDWLHPSMAYHPVQQADGAAALQVLRQTLRPMLDTGLINHHQRHTLMQQMEDHLLHE